ncbi:uncharacterized protein LOC116023565 [Ipomoea triloba]|uniref:uncharacterized protein LOC116023565 n=1 Tax=Ipomoea triloba TaxID=35885 RepID=UPI00125D81EA|nr:uncharacterized protein LOC116023565 [Ipomoea triloba]
MQTPRFDMLNDATVSGLLDEQGNWDEEILHDLFEPVDIRRILATPVSLQFKDTWRWVGDLRGMYSVKNGYQLLTSQSMAVELNVAFSAWDRLWKLPVSPKVKNLLWRCARNIVPVRDVLKQKHVYIGGGCPLCANAVETVEHLFCMCEVASQVWGVRNDRVWKNVITRIENISLQIQSLQLNWMESFLNPNVNEPVNIPIVWFPPPQGFLKCNVDAAIFDDGAGYGAVLRDHQGRFVAARCDRLTSIRDPFLAEALAVKEALS